MTKRDGAIPFVCFGVTFSDWVGLINEENGSLLGLLAYAVIAVSLCAGIGALFGHPAAGTSVGVILILAFCAVVIFRVSQPGVAWP